MISKYYSEVDHCEGYKCPYCGELYVCDDWGYGYDREVETCNKCSKKFMATAHHSINFCTTPDCELNNEEHDLEFYQNTLNGKAYFCKVCKKCVIKEK